MQGEKAGQTKSSTFNTLRSVKIPQSRPLGPTFHANSSVFNMLNKKPHPRGRPTVWSLKFFEIPILYFLYVLYLLYFLPSAASILSIPIYGRKTSGTTIDPSSC